MKRGKCELCGLQSALVDSHIIPAFVFQWMKRTGSNKLRWAGQPNQPRQDGPRLQLLCEICEQRFSRREAWFSRNVFSPTVENRLTIPLIYDENLYYFLVSLAWRVMCIPNKKPPADADRLLESFAEVKQRWGHYLLTGQAPSRDDDVHLIATTTDFWLNGPRGPLLLPAQFLLRRVDASVVSARGRCLVYIKLPRFVVLAAITPFDRSEFINTRVDAGGGALTFPQLIKDEWIGKDRKYPDGPCRARN